MEENKETVSIDQLKMLDLATLFGVIIYSFDQEDRRINADHLHSIESIVLLSASVLLPKGMDEQFWTAAMLSMADALYYRTLGSGSSRPIILPPWDEEDHFNEDCHQFVDAFFVLYAWTLSFNENSRLDFSKYLGPIFTFAGVALEGVARGYHQDDENVQKIGRDFFESYKRNSRSQNVDDDISKKLDLITDIVGEYLKIHD